MQLWIDNTGLQSAGLCLEGKANPGHDYDVRGLLQLATLSIFANKITLNGFETDTIAERTEGFVHLLGQNGLTKDVLSITRTKEPEYALACRTAANFVAPTLRDRYHPDDSALIGVEPPDLPRGIHKRQVGYVSLASEPEGSSRLEELEASALKDKAVGAIDYMMASSAGLREAVARILAANPNFDDRLRYDLNILLRYHLNHALAEQVFSRYAPAIGRAERMDRRNQYIVQALSDMVDRTVRDLRGDKPDNTIKEVQARLNPEPLGVPSFVVALLNRSKGEPRGVIEAAVAFRERSKPLRDALQKLASKNIDDTTPEARFEIQLEIKDLSKQLRRDLRMEKRTSLLRSLDIKSLVELPIVSIKELVKWGVEFWKGRKTAVLTELVRASAYADAPGRLYEKLRARATGSTQ
jgi:hypothetical protein